MARFGDARDYADSHWYLPCHDNIVVGFSKKIIIADEYRHFGVSPADWMPVFLRYPRAPTPASPAGSAEGLYFIPRTDFDLDKLIDHNVSLHLHGGGTMALFPRRHFICSWFDRDLDTEGGARPRWTGLDDCAHFLSMCLKMENIDVANDYVPTLVANLRRRHDTKALAVLTDKDRARVIIKSGIVKPGDTIFYGNKTDNVKHWHSSLLIGHDFSGHGQVATHTFANHAKVQQKDTYFDWSCNTNSTQHPLVTIIHFSVDDPKNLAVSPMLGWWTVTWQGETYYYNFDSHGHVGYLRTRPGKGQIFSYPDARGSWGYWFESMTDVKICWTETGTFEIFAGPRSAATTSLAGTSNGIPGLVALRGVTS